MSVSQIRQTRKSTTRIRSEKSAKQGWMKRMLRLETLEQRQLMAADMMPFHNYLYANDVNGDFAITPLDALVIINKLNTTGSGPLSGQESPSDRSALYDVDGDNNLSPLDALTVINALNNGEGLNELAEIRYQFFSVNADGTAGTQLPDPNPDNLIPEAVIGTGERVIVRTQIKDLRTPSPSGVFSAYHDLSYSNADNSTNEKLQLQWGEFDRLDIQSNVRGGTFTLTYGAETTAPIAVAFTNGIYSISGTATNIRNAIQALPSVGTGNVKVSVLNSNFSFGINFIGDRARTNFVDPVIGSNNLTGGSGEAVTLSVVGQANPSPTNTDVAKVARNHNLSNGTFIDGTGQEVPVTRYTNGQDGVAKSDAPASKRTVTLLGGFSSSSNFLDPTVASQFLNVVDVLFKGAEGGTINFVGATSPLPVQGGTSGDNLGVALFGARAVYLTSAEMILPTATLTIADRLTAVTDSTSVAEDSGLSSVNVIQNDIDRFGTSRGVIAVTQPSVGGTVSFVNGGPNVSFTPTPDYFGPVVFTYTIRNNATPTADTAVGTVSINVTAVNDAPNVIGTQFTVVEDPVSPLVITPAQIFTPGPANESAQTVSLGSLGTTPNGTVSLVGGNINFTPTANFFGNAVFTVTGTDNLSASKVATITVSVTPVNDAPVPFSGTLSVAEDGSLILIGAGAPTDLITNSNPGPGESAVQTVRLISIQGSSVQGGTITTVGSVTTYRPLPNYFGPDSFTYVISDNASPNLEATGTVSINVTSVNDAPVAVNDTGAARFVVLGIAVANPLAVMQNDNAGPLESSDTITIVSVTAPTIGTATVQGDGKAVLFTPPTGQFNTTSTFSYTIRDSGGLTSTANVEVFIIPPVLPFALTDSASIPEDSGAFTLDVIANDFANSGAVKSLLSFTQPGAGTGSVVLDNRGTVGVLTDDRLIYTPPADFFGNAVFEYTMNDDKAGSVASTATVTISVTPVNDPPVAADRTVSATEDIVLTVQASTIISGLSKGPGEDAQSLTITNAVNLTPGSGSVSVVNGNIQYSPALDFNGQVLVLYTVTDNGLDNTTPRPLSATATLTITVAAVNDPPIATADSPATTVENRPVTIAISTLLANDLPGPANESSQSVTFVSLVGTTTSANGGTVTQVGTNLIYTPATSFNGPDSFTYQISDGQATMSTATGTFTVNVSEVNDAPTATTLIRNVYASVPTIFNLTADLASMPKGPANESGQTLRVSQILRDAGTIGAIILNANGTITYTAPLGSSGRDTFRYEVIDNGTTNGVADPKTSIGTFNVDISPFIPSKVRGIAYVDDNNSGIPEANELRLGGIEVTLTVPATATSLSQTLTKQTHVDGSYAFELLPPGVYTVSFAVPVYMQDSPLPNSFTQTIVAPGDVDAEFNFTVLGIVPGYGTTLENLASSFYAKDVSLRTSGVYAAIGSNGRSEWTITQGGFAGDTFQEVVLSDDGTKAYLTAVRGADHSVFTATLNNRQFVKVSDSTGPKLLRILANSSELSWQRVSLAAPPVEISSRARAYLDAVDELFVQENW